METAVTYRKIFRRWAPLAATWLMMSVEGPFLAAVIARLPEPTVNLAAYGVAFSFALICEAPIIMVLSATAALVRDLDSFRKLRNFTFTLNAAVTLFLLVVLLGPFFDWLALDLIELPAAVAARTHSALVLLLPWPAAIGFRRFYQGLLIRQDMTRRVAMGTALRVVGMGSTAIVLYRGLEAPGAIVGAASLSAGVVLESLGTRLMAIGVTRRIEASSVGQAPEELSYRKIGRFYLPLALTSVIALAVQPTVTFFLGGSLRALESLAVLPVINSLTFIFRSMALSYQEVAITLLDGTRESFRRIARFAASLGAVATVGLVLMAFTPLSTFWFRTVSGLSEELTDFSLLPLRLYSLIPFFSVLLAFQRAVLVFGRNTRAITIATVVEVSAIVGVLYLGIHVFELVGVVAAVVALFSGRLLGNGSLMGPGYRVLKSTGIVGAGRAGGAGRERAA